jgi:hypothetical protein
MRKVERSEIKDLVAYERAREGMRARAIAIKAHRRVAVGPNMTVLFENRDTVLFQIQEMVRSERIVDDGRLQEELDVYNALVPEAGQLSATLFLELPELAGMGPEAVRATFHRFQGLEHDSVWLVIDGRRLPALFEAGRAKEEKVAAVHYIRFDVPEAARQALADPEAEVRLLVDHPRYRAEAILDPGTRRALREDLAG